MPTGLLQIHMAKALQLPARPLPLFKEMSRPKQSFLSSIVGVKLIFFNILLRKRSEGGAGGRG